MQKASERIAKNEFTETEIKILQNLLILRRWCKPSELLKMIQGGNYDYTQDRHAYPILHRFVDMGWAERREVGGGSQIKRWEFCITQEGEELIKSLAPVETITQPGTEELSYIHGQMTDQLLMCLRRLAEQTDSVWVAPKVLRDLFDVRVNLSTILYDLTELGVIDQAEWSRNQKPSYRYQINQAGRDYLRYVNSLDQ